MKEKTAGDDCFYTILQSTQYIVLIAMGRAHGGRTNCAAKEAVQYRILQTLGLQTTAFCRGRLKTMFLIGDSYYDGFPVKCRTDLPRGPDLSIDLSPDQAYNDRAGGAVPTDFAVRQNEPGEK